MSLPKAYDPEYGCQFQIFTKHPQYDREWESLDYATDRKDLKAMMDNYREAYRNTGYVFHTIMLPRKYWKLENKLKEELQTV